MERNIKEIIKRNREALGLDNNDIMPGVLTMLNRFVSVEILEQRKDFGCIIADGLIVGYEQ